MANGHQVALTHNFTETSQRREPAAAFRERAAPHMPSTPPPAPHAGARSVRRVAARGAPYSLSSGARQPVPPPHKGFSAGCQ